MPTGGKTHLDPNFLENKNWLGEFLKFKVTDFDKALLKNGEKFWQNAGQKKALTVFKLASQKVPAYKKFLAKHKIDAKKIKTIADFCRLPITNKENYVYSYPLRERCWYGKLNSADIVAMSSGTKGNANYWPRGSYQEYEAAITHELIYKTRFRIDRYKTLLLIGFPMGVYVSGLATLLPSWLVAQKNYGLTILGAGNNKAEALRALRNLQKDFEQIILVGHPFFIKDVIETGKKTGINWQNKRIKLMLCSEGFSESWRNYVAGEAGIKNPADIISTYGSSEMLLKAFETSLSIAGRRMMTLNPHITQKLTGQGLVPNLFQYNPVFRHIEEINNELIFSSASGIPLVRFNLHDHGKVIPYSEMMSVAKISGEGWQLPFVALWGRSDYTMIFYAANIYPQHIHAALNHKKFFSKITGKFSLRKDYLKNMDEFLEINVELKPRVSPPRRFEKIIQKQVVSSLRQLNMEYEFLWQHLEKNLVPKIKLWPYQHNRFFAPGLKPRYIAA